MLSLQGSLKEKIPVWAIYILRRARTKYRNLRFLLRFHRELTACDGLIEGMVSAAHVIRTLVAPKMTILFIPEHPTQHGLAYELCVLLGYAVTVDPNLHWDLAFKYQDTTFGDRAVLDRLPWTVPTINGASHDISKTTVDRAMQQVFGYSAAIDPTRYVGPAVRKSDLNARHDGQVIYCPVPQESLVAGCVYQKLIDDRPSPNTARRIRVPVFGGRIPVVVLSYMSLEDRFRGGNTCFAAEIAEPRDVFSDGELAMILALSRAIGIDFGELDVLRDKADGQVYVVDVNNTPWGWREWKLPNVSPAERRRAIGRYAEAFAALVEETHGSPTR